MVVIKGKGLCVHAYLSISDGVCVCALASFYLLNFLFSRIPI